MHITPAPGQRETKHHHMAYLYPHSLKVTVISFSILVVLLAATFGTSSQSTLARSNKATVATAANNPVLTYKNDLARTGQFSNETYLTTSTVNPAQFGKRVSYPVTGQVYAEPLYVPGLTVSGSSHNVVIVATEGDQIYAFDADQTTATAPLWHTSFLGSGVTTVPSSQVSCNDITPEYGITSTPVIDGSTNTMYVIVNTLESGHNIYRLHAIDITTGHDKSTPTTITATAPGNGAGSSNGVISFNATVEGQRGGLLLINGRVYMDFASHCDNGAYHGWVLSYDASTLQQIAAYNSTKGGNQGGIWQSGEGIASDGGNNIYVMTGNGTFDRSTGGTDLGDSFIRLDIATGEMQVMDYFTPFNQACLNSGDTDLGSSGVVLLPGNELLGSGKEGRLYVLNAANMGQYNTISNPCSNQNLTNVDKIVQETAPNTANGGIWGTPAFWNGSNGQFIYTGGTKDAVRAFAFSNGKVTLPSSSQSPETYGYPGTNPVISSNGTTAGSGIVWTIGINGALYAYDATNLGHELYNTNQQASRDALGSTTKFSVPTIAHGEVFVGTKSSLVIYGNLGSGGPTGYNNIGISDDSNPASANFDGGGRSYSAQTLTAAGFNPGNTFAFNGVNFSWPGAASGNPDNYNAQGQTINFTSNNGDTTLAFLGSSINGPSSGTATITYTDNTTSSFTLALSDWTLNAGKSAPIAGNKLVATLPYRNSSGTKDTDKPVILYTDTSITPGKIVKSVTLPATFNQGGIHIFTIGSKGSGTVTTYNNTGISNDSNPAGANFDGGGRSYSAQTLTAAGFNPGSTYTFSGVNFTWPNAAVATPDNYDARGQTVNVTSSSGNTTLAFLGAGTNGPSSGTATITFTDNTTTTFTLAFSDWTLNGGKSAPISGNQVVVTLPYRNSSTVPTTSKPVILYTTTSIPSGKTVKSITFPASFTQGHIHVFAIGSK